VAPVDVLLGLGVLSQADYEDWRFGKVPFLERVCKANLTQLARIMHEVRVYAMHEAKSHTKANTTRTAEPVLFL